MKGRTRPEEITGDFFEFESAAMMTDLLVEAVIIAFTIGGLVGAVTALALRPTPQKTDAKTASPLTEPRVQD